MHSVMAYDEALERVCRVVNDCPVMLFAFEGIRAVNAEVRWLSLKVQFVHVKEDSVSKVNPVIIAP